MKFENVVISPAPYKGLLSSSKVAKAISEGILDVFPKTNITTLSMSDGGMGLVHVVNEVLGGKVETVVVCSPYGDEVEAKYLILDDEEKEKAALISMASAAGYHLVEEEVKDLSVATTKGVGQIVKDAISKGCTKIMIGLGDSATIDVGVGMASELGIKFLDDRGEKILPIPKRFPEISRIDLTEFEMAYHDIKFIGFADVMNPVVGDQGAVNIFGAQKGLTLDKLPEIEAGVERVVEIMESELGVRLRDEPMTGAAGGMGAGVMGFFNGSLMRGATSVAKLIGLEILIQDADLVITGEGKLDYQSFFGKVPAEVVAISAYHNKPCWAVAGVLEDEEGAKHAGFEKVIEVSKVRVPKDGDESYKLIKEAVKKSFSSI